ncbi:PHP domain-containing protein [Exilibacterium tricleocarpae]|uniref:PHP domain-containing protein n=1 Tax=Exilibacterium tricleocarpae TaxID=2591008 RepID=A0A545TM14_9GAMM|nr:PHP domain-containing protein [Exilibacterium tricleocarpae]TQV78270.1 PHP domain-containing protein [Exilibacterium tricleocarpae]
MPLVDLHTHSTASDGILSPENLVSRAKSKGVEVLALTDHDTLAGVAAATAAAAAAGLKLIAGIELSSQWRGRGIHIVGLNVDTGHPAMAEARRHQLQVREERATRIADKLAKYGFEGTLAGARRWAGEAAVGRPHFARYLEEAGHVGSVNEAFKKYLGAGKPGDIKEMWPAMDRVVGWISAAGGVAVLAHPDKYQLTRTRLVALLEDFCEGGGRALEVISGFQQQRLTLELAELARRFELHVSCGSDFHVPDQPWQELGACGTLPPDCPPVWALWDAA